MTTTVERLKAAVAVINGVISEMEGSPPPVVVPPPVVEPPPVIVPPPVVVGKIIDIYGDVPAEPGVGFRRIISGNLDDVVAMSFIAPSDYARFRAYYVEVPSPRSTWWAISLARGDFTSQYVVAKRPEARPCNNASVELTTGGTAGSVVLIPGTRYYLNERFDNGAGWTDRTFKYEFALERQP